MSNKDEVISIIRSMMEGTRFVEISTYLRNHTTLQGHAFDVVRDNLAAMQRMRDAIEGIAIETLEFCD